MSGSRTLIPTVLVYNFVTDALKWVTLSEGTRMEQSQSGWEILDSEDPAFQHYQQIASPKPECYHQEVTGDNRE